MKYFSTVEVDENGEYYMIIPDELVKELGWNIGDTLEWTIEGDCIILSRDKAKEDESDSSN